jgi:hypothetical protein
MSRLHRAVRPFAVATARAAIGAPRTLRVRRWANCAGSYPGFAENSFETAAIAKVMRDIWDRPDARLDLDPVVAVDGYAIARWTQGELGGRALLQKHGGAWQVVLCSGDPLCEASTARAAAVPAATAERLTESLCKAEAAIPAERRKQLSLFQGLVKMGERTPERQHRQSPVHRRIHFVHAPTHSFFVMYRFYQTPADASVWIDALAIGARST